MMVTDVTIRLRMCQDVGEVVGCLLEFDEFIVKVVLINDVVCF